MKMNDKWSYVSGLIKLMRNRSDAMFKLMNMLV